ncbi:DUF2306 domain-containing protein [Terrabacter sp. 2RAF25]|uniref:DUF2306 domain-containing protein n=1 Tax=Terrabacter sp. 2RAF25 TaxID=3232998 RepID=UPI003F960EB8
MTRRQRGWRIPAALVALSAVPLAAGTARLVELAGGPRLIPSDPRFTASPLPVIVHIVGAAVYALLGAVQFVPALRRRHPRWHRVAGRAVVAAGAAVAGSALWLTLFFPPEPGSGPLLFALRLVFGPAMVAGLVLGMTSIRRGDVPAHRAWMARTYAIALGAGTQAFTEGIGGALLGHSALVLDASRGAAWVLNLAVAEWAIRRTSPDRPRRARRARRARRVPAGLVVADRHSRGTGGNDGRDRRAAHHRREGLAADAGQWTRHPWPPVHSR